MDNASIAEAYTLGSCDLRCPGLSAFYSLVVSIPQPRVCTIPGAHLLGSTAHIQRNIRADCFCALVNCAAVGPSVFIPWF